MGLYDWFHLLKKPEKAVEKREESLAWFLNQRGDIFETLKHDMCANPNAVIFTKKGAEMNIILIIKVDASFNHSTHAKKCAATFTKNM